MKRIIVRIKKFLSLFYPKSLRRIFDHLHSIAYPQKRSLELIDIIGKNNYSSFLEVGVWKGDNIIKIASFFSNVKCYGVDPYDYSEYDNQSSIKDDKSLLLKSESENVYQYSLSLSNRYKNYSLIRKSSLQAARGFKDESLDVVFIDANHSYESVKSDISLWLPKVRIGGYLCGHDYSIYFFGVIQAVNEMLGVDNIVIKSDDTWFFLKK
jgi:hypothetical protein